MPEKSEPFSSVAEAAKQHFRKTLAAGMAPDRVADHVFDAVREGQFYLLTHPIYKQPIRIRTEHIIRDRPPTDLRSFFQQKGAY